MLRKVTCEVNPVLAQSSRVAKLLLGGLQCQKYLFCYCCYHCQLRCGRMASISCNPFNRKFPLNFSQLHLCCAATGRRVQETRISEL